jgi:hypothetical protein
VEVDDVKDAQNTLAVFLRGPAGVRIEYVEHKPGFAERQVVGAATRASGRPVGYPRRWIGGSW